MRNSTQGPDYSNYRWVENDAAAGDTYATSNGISTRTLTTEPDGVYYPIWQALQTDKTLTAVVRSRQLHIYRNGKKVLILAGKALPKTIREDKLH